MQKCVNLKVALLDAGKFGTGGRQHLIQAPNSRELGIVSAEIPWIVLPEFVLGLLSNPEFCAEFVVLDGYG